MIQKEKEQEENFFEQNSEDKKEDLKRQLKLFDDFF